jgi:hypothetical protein
VWNGAGARCRIDVGGIRNSNHQGPRLWFDDFLSDLYQIVIGMASIWSRALSNKHNWIGKTTFIVDKCGSYPLLAT